MGNHEFCEDCGESDFHIGRPCDPKKVAARKAQEEKFKRSRDIAVSEMQQKLRAANIKFDTDEYGNAIVRPSW